MKRNPTIGPADLGGQGETGVGQKEVWTGVRWEEPSVASMAAPYKQSDHFPCAPLDLLVRDLLAPPERSIHWDTSKVTTFHV